MRSGGQGSERRKERESNPQGPKAHPFSKRDTAPVAVLPSGPGRRRTCTRPGKNRELCRVELRSHEVSVATCRRPGASSPLGFLARRCVRVCEGDSVGHTARSQERAQRREAAGGARCRPGKRECGRQGSNLRRPAFQAGALPAELRPRVNERGWGRTSDLLFVRQALVPAELLALDPGQGIEPRPPGSEPGVLPVRRSRNKVAGGCPGAEAPAG